MSASKLRLFGVALLLAAGAATRAQAQLDDPNSPFYGPSNDLQWFEPVDLDLDGRGLRDRAGFFFRYEKLYWSVGGERVEVGDPDTVQRQFRIYSAVPLDPETALPINPMLLTNSIESAIPRADFHFGDRYEFGFNDEKGNGWMFSVLDGPDSFQTFNIGLGADRLLGDVFVSFRSDLGTFAGFLDLDGDGFADDPNNNGIHGPDGIDLDGDGTPDVLLIGAPPDYDDLVTLTTAFGEVVQRNNTKVNGVEIMRTHRLKNSHYQVSHQNNQFDIFYGARFLQLDDQFVFSGDGGLFMGETFFDTQIVNNIVGPQVGFQYNRHQGRWRFDSQGRFMLGYNIQNWSQNGFIGGGIFPSDPNSPLYGRAKSFSYGRSEDDLSPMAELRANLSYHLTDSIALKVGWTGTFVDNIRRAGNHVDYAYNADGVGKVMGFRDAGSEQIFVNGVNFGVEIHQ